jgi:signal transduction histidine kinase
MQAKALSRKLNVVASLVDSLKLSQKMLFIVAVPLVFELLVFSTIWVVMAKAESQAQTAETASLLVNRTNAITNEIYAAGGSLAAFIATKNKKFDARFSEFVTAAELNLAEMEKLPLSKAQSEIISDERVHVGEMLGFLKDMREQAGDSSSHRHLLAMHNQHKKAQAAAQSYFENMQDVLARFEDDARVQRYELGRSKEMVSRVLGTGMILSLLLALTMSLGFARHIIRQMHALQNKARKLVTFDELGQPANGSDEISELDRTLHGVAALMAQNAEKEKQLETIKRNLIAMVSHDLRAPLTSTRAFLGLLGEGQYGALNGKGRMTLRSVDSSLNHVCELVEDMLSFASSEIGDQLNRRELVDLGVIISDAVDVVAAAAQLKSISIEVEQYPEAYLEADETRIVQVFTNIMSNSVKYCPDGSTIKISTTFDETSCTISIEDNGPGMNTVPAFQPFARGENSQDTDGRGLGLFLSKQVIEAHGGTIELDRNSMTGTKFNIRLPIQCGETWTATAEAKAS